MIDAGLVVLLLRGRRSIAAELGVGVLEMHFRNAVEVIVDDLGGIAPAQNEMPCVGRHPNVLGVR